MNLKWLSVSAGDGLRRKVTRAAFYSILMMVVGKGFGIAQLAITARLLIPADFGIFSLSTLLLAGALTLTSFGIERVLVQRPDLPSAFVRSVWTINVFRGALISLCCLIGAPLYADIVGEPMVGEVLQVLFIVPLLTSLRTPNQITAERDFRFDQIASFNIVSGCLQFAVMIALVWSIGDVYALAIGQVCISLIGAVMSWAWFGMPPWPGIDRSFLKEIFSVGGHYLVIAVGSFIMVQADNMIIGSVLGVTLLGFYALAYRISQLAVDILNNVIGKVAFPVYCDVQSQKDRLRETLGEILLIQFSLLMPVCVSLYIFAPELVLVLLGDRYSQSAVLLQILVLLTLGRGLVHMLVPVILGVGKVAFASRLKLIEVPIFVSAVWIGVQYGGVEGGALGASLTYLFSGIVRVVYVTMIVNAPAGFFAAKAAPAALCSTVAAVFAELFQVWTGAEGATALLFSMLVFSLVYFSMSWKLQTGLTRVIKKSWASIKA